MEAWVPLVKGVCGITVEIGQIQRIYAIAQITEGQNIYLSADSCMRSQAAERREEGVEVIGKACW